MNYKVFFTDYCEGKILESGDARVATKEDILHSMDCVLHVPDNFLGIIDSRGTTLQFMVCKDRSITIDIPDVSKQGSYTKISSLSDCLDLIRQMPADISTVDIDGLTFNSWHRPPAKEEPWWKFWN
jgi:hypothetical protein